MRLNAPNPEPIPKQLGALIWPENIVRTRTYKTGGNKDSKKTAANVILSCQYLVYNLTNKLIAAVIVVVGSINDRQQS